MFGFCVVLPRRDFFQAVVLALVPLALILRTHDVDGVLAAAVVASAWMPSRERSGDTMVVVALAGLGAYLGPPDTETTFIVTGVALGVAGVSAAWPGIRSVAFARGVYVLAAVVASASIDASVGRPQALYGVLATFAPLMGLTLIAVAAGARHELVSYRERLWFIPTVVATMLLGARFFGRAAAPVSFGFFLIAVVAWTVGLALQAGLGARRR